MMLRSAVFQGMADVAGVPVIVYDRYYIRTYLWKPKQ